MSEEEDDKIVHGFDRGIDYTEMKTKLIEGSNAIIADLGNLKDTERGYIRKKGIILRRYIYTIIACIQLRNGSRISEAITAFKLFIQPKQDLNDKVTVKIAKSKSTKYKDGKKYKTKTRYRKMVYPIRWLTETIYEVDNIRDYINDYKGELKKRVLDFLNRYYKCNTHSLRYAFINNMLYKEKKEMTVVAKFVGHQGVGQLVRYTQAKESDKLFDIDI